MPELTRIRQLRADVDDRQESAEDVRADDAGDVLLSNCRKEERHALAPPRRDRQVVLSATKAEEVVVLRNSDGSVPELIDPSRALTEPVEIAYLEKLKK